MKNNSQHAEHQTEIETIVTTEQEIASLASLASPQLHEQLKLEDAIRESVVQKWSHFTRVAVALVLHTFVITYLVAFGYFLLDPIFKWDILEYEKIESTYDLFSITLIPILITSLTIIFRFSNTISKIIEPFAKSSSSSL